MNFIREYLYETILIAVVVILAPVLYWLASSQAELAEEERQKVEQVHSQIKNLRGRSEAELAARKQSVENIKAGARQLEALSVDYNRRNYEILQVVSGVGQAQTVSPMFPWPVEEMYRELDAYRAVQEAIAEIQSNPAFTRAPYVQDLQEDYAKRYEKLQRLQQRKLQKLEGEQREGEPGFDEDFIPPPDFDGPPGGYPGGYPGGPSRFRPPSPMPPGAGGEDEQGREGILTDDQLRRKAWEEAMFRFALASAREGTLYVDQRAFARNRPDRASGRERDRRYDRYDDRRMGTDEWQQLSRNQQIVRLWEDQVRLWIIEDILAAVQQTNEQGLARRRREAGVDLPANVLTSPIKRLVWVDSTGEFYTGSTENEEYEMEGPPPMTDFESPMAATMVTPKANTITGDVSNKEYEVVQYRFTVVMEPRFAGQLQRNLAQRNYHALLGFTARKAANKLTLEESRGRDYDAYEPGGRTAETEQIKQRSDVHYYGAKPVMEITFHGQLRLLTEWVRGKPAGEQVAGGAGGAFGDTEETPDPRALFDPDPLVPWQVLARPDIQYALREADKQRVKIRKEMAGISTTPTEE